MTNSSIKKYSILGLVLVTASAVTAAVLPKNKKSVKVNDGRLIFNSLNGSVLQNTCKPDGVDCDYTVTDGVVSTTTFTSPETSITNGPNFSSHGVNTTGA